MPTETTLAEALRDYRDRHHLTQAELARKLRVNIRSLQGYEAGVIPHAARRRRIIAFLNREKARQT